MNSRTLTHPNLNHGRETTIWYPIRDEELEAQVEEIFVLDQYGYEKCVGGVYLDIGANIGLASLYFSGFAREIHAFEPNPEIYKALVKNTEAFPQIKTYNYAWANLDGRDFLYGDQYGSLPQTFYNNRESGFNPSALVNCISPATWFNQVGLEHVDVMKIDVEEAEYVILPSDSFAEVTPKIDVIIGEAHNGINRGFPEVIPEILKTYGYTTTFPKLKKHNYLRKFVHSYKGVTKSFQVGFDTIFVSKRT